MVLEEQRFLHEDLERLEQGISDRIATEPRQASSLYIPVESTPNTTYLGQRETQSRPPSGQLPGPDP